MERKQKRTSNREPASPIAFQGSDPRLKGHLLQCHNKLGRKPNQFKKTMSKIKDIFSIDHDALHVLELFFRPENTELTEPTKSSDNAHKAKLMR